MERAGRPVSESYQPMCFSGSQLISYSSEAGTVGAEDEDDQAPIFSLSKSAMDVVMATVPPSKRDPAWTQMDLRRSSSTNTHSEQNSVTLQQLHPNMWQHINAANSHQLALASQDPDLQSPPALTERWIASMKRWSECSGSTQSRSSTPETIVWRDGTSRPSSLTQETPCSAADSPMSKSPPSTPSPLVSQVHTPDQDQCIEDLLPSSSSQLMVTSENELEDLPVSSPSPTPFLSPLQTETPTPVQSPELLQLTGVEDEGFPEKNAPFFQFPSPIQSSVCLVEESAPSDPGGLVDDVTEELRSPGEPELLELGGERSPTQLLVDLMGEFPAEEQQESERGGSVCHLELPGEVGQSCPPGRSSKSPLVGSLSDSRLGESCRCSVATKALKAELLRGEGKVLVDVAVQTISPFGSLWALRRNTSNSNLSSHSILGSPPGSKLNLKSSVGSNSNLVSPSSSMFPVSSGEEEEKHGDDPHWDVDAASSQDLERRRSCLKIQGEVKDELGRRSSMKQVQWDEDGMTWDVHGASVDPEVLSSAIRRQLELQNTPKPKRRSSKKKRAPKPPIISNVVKTMAPDLNPAAGTCTAEAQSEKTEEGGGETVKAPRRISRAEAANVKDDEVYGVPEGGTLMKASSGGNGLSRNRSMIRSLRPSWCGGSRKTVD